MPGVLSLDAEGNARALDLLERAMERDPCHALAAALAAWAHAQRVAYHFTTEPQADRARGIEPAHRAQALSGDASVLAVLGNALTLLGELDTAELVIGMRWRSTAGSAWAWSRSGWLEVYRVDPEAAIERFKIALHLAPDDSLAFNSLVGIGRAHFKAGNDPEAARWQERALIEHPSAIWVHRTLRPAYVLAGARREARRAWLRCASSIRSSRCRRCSGACRRCRNPDRNLIVDALNDVGLPRREYSGSRGVVPETSSFRGGSIVAFYPFRAAMICSGARYGDGRLGNATESRCVRVQTELPFPVQTICFWCHSIRASVAMNDREHCRRLFAISMTPSSIPCSEPT